MTAKQGTHPGVHWWGIHKLVDSFYHEAMCLCYLLGYTDEGGESMSLAVIMDKVCARMKDKSISIVSMGPASRDGFQSLYFSDRRKKCYLDSKGFKFIA